MASDEQVSDGRLDSRVVPVMREAVATVQLVVFGQLKESLTKRYPEWQPEQLRLLAGCIVNDLFGTPSQDEEAVRFAGKERELVERELWNLAASLPDMLSSLTDALRMQTLCDHTEGINSLPTLLRAKALGVLLEERTVPMPSTFMLSVRRLGAQHGLLKPMELQEDPPAE